MAETSTKGVNLSSIKSQECNICGGLGAKSHYGGNCCSPCKSFFRFSVLDDVYKKYVCISNKNFANASKGANNYKIANKTKKCRKCRFDRCLKSGMRMQWVLPKRENNKTTATNASLKDLSSEISENIKIAKLLEYYKKSCEAIPYTIPPRQGEPNHDIRSFLTVLGVFYVQVRRLIYFTKMLPEFLQINIVDQRKILKNALMPMMSLRYTLNYCPETKSVHSPGFKGPENYPEMHVEDMKNLFPPNLFDSCIKFTERIYNIGVDETTIVLLMLIVLFQDGVDILEKNKVSKFQEEFSETLNLYLIRKLGRREGTRVFATLLCQLTELEEMENLFKGVPLNLAHEEVVTVHKLLHQLEQSPFPPKLPLPDNETDEGNVSTPSASSSYQHLEPKIEEHRNPSNFVILLSKMVNLNGLNTSYFVDSPHKKVQTALLESVPMLLDNPVNPLSHI